MGFEHDDVSSTFWFAIFGPILFVKKVSLQYQREDHQGLGHDRCEASGKSKPLTCWDGTRSQPGSGAT